MNASDPGWILPLQERNFRNLKLTARRNAVPELEEPRPRKEPRARRGHTEIRRGETRKGCDEISLPIPPPTVGDDDFLKLWAAPRIAVKQSWWRGLLMARPDLAICTHQDHGRNLYIVSVLCSGGPSFLPT